MNIKENQDITFTSELKTRLKQPDFSFIQVILGPRQIGKTTEILKFLEEWKGPQHYISLDGIDIKKADWIIQEWKIAQGISSECLLVIDEIQKIDQWSEVIKSLWDEQKRKKTSAIKLVLLGSSSLHIRKGLTESLAGRYELMSAHHWNFERSQNVFGFTLEQYLQFGGYPGSYSLINDPKRWSDYISHSIVDNVISKDILLYENVKSPALFRQAFQILMHYPAQEVSYTKLLGQLQDKGNTDLIKHYMELYEGAFLIKNIQKYSSKAFKRKSSFPKILPLCPALYTRNISGQPLNPEQIGRVFELTVGAELSRLPGELSYWRENNDEVDFIYEENDNIFAIEVKSGRKKNIHGLTAFCEQYKNAISILISIDNFKSFSKNPRDFLFSMK